jgi:threonine/homoserine/homoserine lactone efflux protein
LNSIIYLQIILTCTLGAASPGPSLVLISRNAIANGKTSGVITGLGHAFGIFFYALLSIFSISIIYKINPIILDIFTFSLAIYLLFLAFKVLKENKHKKENEPSKKILINNFLDGFLICFLNPKITIFFFAIFSQFITNDQSLSEKFIIVSIASIIDFIWYSFISIIIGNFYIRQFVNKSNYLDITSCIIFIIISLFILTKLFWN